MDANALENEARSAIASASTLEELDEARVRYLGRKSELKQALRNVRDPESGRVLNTLRERIEQAVAEREGALSEADLERRLAEERVDVTLPGEPVRRGHLHLITQIRREVEDVFLGLGYQIVDGDEVEDTRHLFDALNMPPGHVTRSPLHTLFLLMRALFGEDRRVRFGTDFFPFTEPSLQAAVSCFICEGVGCPTCKQTGWIEMGGSGLVDPNVLVNVGYDPEELSGFAFGLGLERIAMLRHGIPDIRMFLENDLRFLRQF